MGSGVDMVTVRRHRPTLPALGLYPDSPLVLPWDVLCPDNNRLMWVYGQARLTSEYRRAKAQVQERAGLWWRGPMLTDPVEVYGRFWFPDRRKRDAGNYRKLLTDALTQIAYVDDQLVHDERWHLIAIDREHPRCELTVVPLSCSETKGAA